MLHLRPSPRVLRRSARAAALFVVAALPALGVALRSGRAEPPREAAGATTGTLEAELARAEAIVEPKRKAERDALFARALASLDAARQGPADPAREELRGRALFGLGRHAEARVALAPLRSASGVELAGMCSLRELFASMAPSASATRFDAQALERVERDAARDRGRAATAARAASALLRGRLHDALGHAARAGVSEQTSELLLAAGLALGELAAPSRPDADPTALGRALGLLERAVALDPWIIEARLWQASTLVRAGRASEAVTLLGEIEAACPVEPLAVHRWCRWLVAPALVAAGRADAARKHLESVLAADPSHVLALHDLGFLALRRGDLVRAAMHAERALALAPRYPSALVLRAAIAARAAGMVSGPERRRQLALAAASIRRATASGLATEPRATHPAAGTALADWGAIPVVLGAPELAPLRAAPEWTALAAALPRASP
jgi:tetratricopeptide (TPR) repeat protein